MPESLGRQHVLDLAGADAEGECAEGPMGAGVAVAADDGRSRERQAQLRTDHVNDALAAALDVVKRDSELTAVGSQGLDLAAGEGVADVELVLGRARCGRAWRK